MHRILWLLLLPACGPDLVADRVDGDIVDEADEAAPVIVHEPVTGPVVFNEDTSVTATITDEGTGILFNYLYYKFETDGSDAWNERMMIANGDTFTATIPGDEHRSGGVFYYIRALDKADNGSYSPDEGPDDPYHFRLTE